MTGNRTDSPLARGILSGGYAVLALGLGVGLGYWASDWAIRFVPSVVASILTLWVFGFSLFALGAHLQRAPQDDRALGHPARVCASLAVSCLAGLVVVLLLGRETPLTALSEGELLYTHELDARYFRDLDRSLRGTVAELSSRRELFHPDGGRVPTAGEEALLLDAWRSYLDAGLAMDQIRRFHEDFYRFDLSRLERVRHVRSFLLSFAAELSLYENTMRIIELLEANENATRFLNVERPELGIERDSVARVREELSGLTDFGRVSAGRRYLSFLERVHHARVDAMAQGLDWLWEDTSRYVAAIERRRSRDRVAMSLANDFAPIRRGVKRVSFPLQKGVAELMGDTRLKRAGHYLITPRQAQAMEEKLLPGDVLLSRKNWYLSNIGLPGFWPHAILYVGGNDDLARAFDAKPDVGRWVELVSGRRDLEFTEYLREQFPLAWRRREIEGGDAPPLAVVEAVSEGVIQNSLYGASGDFIVALRPRVTDVVRARAVLRAFSYLGRPYDFDFDFATDDALVCTEVVWRAYRSADGLSGLELEPVSVLGRTTLPANEIARVFASEFGSESAQFEFVYYLQGVETELRAVPGSVGDFLETPDRSKWDLDL